jgi:hypothetical protein
MEVITGGAVACPFEEACTLALVGPSRSGKSTLLRNILQHKDVMFTTPVTSVLYCYNVWSDEFNQIKDTEFVKGLPTMDDIEKLTASRDHTLLVMDDLGELLGKNKFVSDIFTTISHHYRMSCCITLQNLYMANIRTLSLNLMYIILFKNCRDVQQVKTLGTQLGLRKVLLEAYTELTERYGYLLIDLTGRCTPKLLIRRHILPGENMVTYG